MSLCVAVLQEDVTCHLSPVLSEVAKVVSSLGKVVTLLAEFFCKLPFACPCLLRFAGFCFVQVSAFQKRSRQRVRDQRDPSHSCGWH